MNKRESGLGRLKRLWREDSWVRPFLGQYRKALFASLGLGIAAFLFAVGLMFVSGYLISDAAEQPLQGLFSLLVPLGFVQVFGIGKPFLSYYERLTSHDWVLRISSSLRAKLFGSVEKGGVFWGATHRIGDALGLLADDIDHIQNLYLRTVFPLATAWALWALATVAFGILSPAFGALMFVAIAVLCLVLPLMALLVNAAHQLRVKQLSHELYARTYDDLAGLADWTFAQRRDDYIGRLMEADTQMAREQAALSASLRRHELAARVVFGIASAAVLLWAAVHFGTMPQPDAASGFAGRPADWIAAFVLGFFPLAEAFTPLVRAASQASEHLDAVENLNALDEEGAGRAALPSEHEHAVPEAPYALDLRGVRFGYGDGDEVLHGIDLHLEPAEKLAVLGPSGSGKSTLLALLRGDLAPTGGSVTLGGVETSMLGDDAHRYFGVIQQDTYLFDATLLENLTLGEEQITRDRAEAALRSVGLGALLDRLPKGLDTPVDEAGLRFSGGERHRIALARILLRDEPIVLLDEPSSGLDPLTERELLDTLFEVLEDRTIVMVTHHLAGVEHVGRVVFVEDGVIELSGSPEELERTSPRYRQLLAFDRGSL